MCVVIGCWSGIKALGRLLGWINTAHMNIIFYQIIDSCLYFPESSVIFIARVAEETKTKSVSNVNKVVGQKFTKMPKMVLNV